MSGTLAIVIEETTIIAWVQAEVRRFVLQCRCSSRDAWTLAIVASEAATNVQKYGRRGAIQLVLESDAIVFTSEDEGPGVSHPETALRDGVSEGVDLSTVPGRKARGLGTGLGAIQRLMGELSIERKADGGTRLVARHRISRGP